MLSILNVFPFNQIFLQYSCNSQVFPISRIDRFSNLDNTITNHAQLIHITIDNCKNDISTLVVVFGAMRIYYSSYSSCILRSRKFGLLFEYQITGTNEVS